MKKVLLTMILFSFMASPIFAFESFHTSAGINNAKEFDRVYRDKRKKKKKKRKKETKWKGRYKF